MSASARSEYVTTSIKACILEVGLTAPHERVPLPVASDLTTAGKAKGVDTGTPYAARI
jgi:hypothetical protein